jgi:hypothetical protein
LIIDEVGFRPLDRAEANLFFRLVSTRYERGSILLAGGIFRGKRIPNHVAYIVRDQVGLIDLECVEHAGDIVALRLLVVATARPRR